MSKYTYSELLYYCKQHKIRTPVTDLISYGIKCNWLKKNKQPFKSISTFVNYYNSVWIKKNGNSDKGYWQSKWKKKENTPSVEIPSNWEKEGIVINGVRCFPVYRDAKGNLINYPGKIAK